MQKYQFNSEYDELGRKKYKRIIFGTVGGIFAILFVLTLFNTINNPKYDLTVVLISFLGLILLMTPIVIVGYFTGVKLQQRLMTGYYILLDEDNISLKSDNLMGVTINRNEVSELVEEQSFLKITSKKPKQKTILVPVNLEGYAEIKTQLQSWMD